MEIAITIKYSRQIGIETWRDFLETKIFKQTNTLFEIELWIQSIDDNADISNAIISVCK
jgi:hypothetical protein